jgi:plastocyanin
LALDVALATLPLLLAGCARANATGVSDVPPPPPVVQSSGASSQSGAVAANAVTEVAATLSEYSISLSTTTAKPGTVRFKVQNVGERKHNLRIYGNGVDKMTRDLAPRQSAQLEVRIVDPGPYTVYCDLADHADRGMQLTFNVEP